MRKKLIILAILIFQQSLYAQKEIVGKVEFHKSVESEWKTLESFPDGTITSLTNRKHKIKIYQRDSIIEFETDSAGTFKIQLTSQDAIKIKVNDHSPVFNETFEFDLREFRDTLKLKISDKKLAVYRDSIMEPEFHKKYNEKQAEIDFKNGTRQLLWYSFCWMSDDYFENQKKIVAEYRIKKIVFGDPSREKIRIMYRYNQVMKKLIGINKNVW